MYSGADDHDFVVTFDGLREGFCNFATFFFEMFTCFASLIGLIHLEISTGLFKQNAASSSVVPLCIGLIFVSLSDCHKGNKVGVG